MLVVGFFERSKSADKNQAGGKESAFQRELMYVVIDRAGSKRLSDIIISTVHGSKGLQIISVYAVIVFRPISVSQIRCHVKCP